MPDKLHPEVAAFAGLLTSLAAHILSKVWDITLSADQSAEMIVCVMWIAQRLARKYLPEDKEKPEDK